MGRRAINNKQLPILDKKAIKIDEPIFTYGSKFEIAQSLRICRNLVRNYIQTTGGSLVPFGIPALPSLTGVSFSAPALAPDNSGIWGANPERTHFLTGAKEVGAPGRNLIYDLETGLPVQGINFGMADVTDWSFTFASNISTPTTFVTGKDVINKGRIFEVVPGITGLAVGAYVTNFDPDSQFGFEARPRILYYHLNRVWLAYVSMLSRRSLIFFTDALDVFTVRGTNFLDFPDKANVIFRASASDLDPGAQAHMLIGGDEKVFILDGDPTLGNATFRQLKKAFGIRSLKQVCETSEGAAFIANDNRIYLVPRGALEPVPIDDRIRNQFTHLDDTLMLGFRFPYIYVFASPASIWLGDLTNLQSGVFWSGPHQVGTPLISSGFISDNPFQPRKTYVTSQSGGNTVVSVIDDSISMIQDQKIESGYFSAPDSHVKFKRTFLTFQQTGVDQHFRLTIGDTLMRTDFVDFIVPAADLPIIDQNEEVLVTIPIALGGEGFFVRLECSFPQGRMEFLRNWIVEYRIDPRKH